MPFVALQSFAYQAPNLEVVVANRMDVVQGFEAWPPGVQTSLLENRKVAFQGDALASVAGVAAPPAAVRLPATVETQAKDPAALSPAGSEAMDFDATEPFDAGAAVGSVDEAIEATARAVGDTAGTWHCIDCDNRSFATARALTMHRTKAHKAL